MKSRKKVSSLIILSALIFLAAVPPGEKKFTEIKKYNVPEAKQGVAVDKDYFYAIDTRGIAKYDKTSGKLVKKWKDKEGGQIKHLDSGVIIEGKLYCAHSNYPEFPMTSSIEIFDPESLNHIGTHSFGINYGSCTWVDRHDGFWWAGFAHYNKWKDSTLTDVRWTSVIKFDDQWRELESWTFPQAVLNKFENMSNSGGAWGPGGNLFCTGHNAAELYVLKIPAQGSILELVNIIPVNCTGQGIAWDKSDPYSIYTIRRSDREVIHSKLSE